METGFLASFVPSFMSFGIIRLCIIFALDMSISSLSLLNGISETSNKSSTRDVYFSRKLIVIIIQLQYTCFDEEVLCT